jgi:phosphate acetyltransferase
MILKLKQNIKGKNIRIVFPEGSEPRVLEAVAMLLKEDLVTPILLGEKKEILKMLENYNIDKTRNAKYVKSDKKG